MTLPALDADPDADADAARLRELGYPQELARHMGLVDNVAMGIASISPVVGLYGVAVVGMAVAGPAWVWGLPVSLAGQGPLLAVFFPVGWGVPLAGGAVPWARRPMGGRR